MTPADLLALTARHAAATPDSFRYGISFPPYDLSAPLLEGGELVWLPGGRLLDNPNVAFVIKAHADIGSLLAENAELRALIAECLALAEHDAWLAERRDGLTVRVAANVQAAKDRLARIDAALTPSTPVQATKVRLTPLNAALSHPIPAPAEDRRLVREKTTPQIEPSPDGKIQKDILYFGQRVTLACDGKCGKAWGINNRPRVTLGDGNDPDDYAFLADNEQSSFMTGQALVVDGGATARLSTE